jgi:hypothetical protein
MFTIRSRFCSKPLVPEFGAAMLDLEDPGEAEVGAVEPREMVSSEVPAGQALVCIREVGGPAEEGPPALTGCSAAFVK